MAHAHCLLTSRTSNDNAAFSSTSLHTNTHITAHAHTGNMATPQDKENVAPLTSSDPLQHKSSSPAKKNARKGRSKSIGPGGLDDLELEKEKKGAKQDAKNRRKSTYVPATKSIISTDMEKAERQAARRKTLANRRVSFAPEATLHTWDVVEFMRDQTTSTDSSDNTRRTTRSAGDGGTPFKPGSALDSDPPSTPPEQADDADDLHDPEHQRDAHQKKRRRGSGGPSMNFNLDDVNSSSGMSGSSDAEETESEEEGSDDETGTAMSLDMGDNTAQSLGGSDSSTSSSARLEANLRMAAHQAGTRGIEYDEYGDASMELAGEEVTNAFQPFVGKQDQKQPLGSASMDQENVNPFSPAFKAQLVSGTFSRPSTVQEEDTGDLSMDMTRAIGGVLQQPEEDSTVSSNGDGTMEITQAVGQIKPQGQKRRRSTTDAGSPGAVAPTAQSKRRRSSAARSSMGDDTMDLTMAVGGIKETASPAKPQRRRVSMRRRSSGVASIASDQDGATVDFTRAVGGVKAADQTNHTSSSYDENEELSMDLTAVMGGVEAAERVKPATPRKSLSPLKGQANTTPKEQERFKNAPDSGARKLLTPMFEKQVQHSPEKQLSSTRSKKAVSPAVRTGPNAEIAPDSPHLVEGADSADDLPTKVSQRGSPMKVGSAKSKRVSVGDHRAPLRATPLQSPARPRGTTPDSEAKRLLDAQLETTEPSPIVAKQLRSSPVKAAPATPEQLQDEPTQDARRLTDSIKLMSTPRKDALKNVTPKKQASAVKQASPAFAPSSRLRPTPRSKTQSQSQSQPQSSPAKQLADDVNKINSGDWATEKVQLQDFLELANIRFMDLTATKRRMTTAITPSKARKPGQMVEEPGVNLESAIVAGGCTLPELEMYEHACHELKRYISDGKKVIKELESSTAREAPPLIKAYMAANHGRRAVLDTQMRDIKTQARLRSKEMWYAWRSQLLEDLMKALQGIGEGLISDDEALSNAEHILHQALPGLTEKHEALQQEAERLAQEAAATNDDEKEELGTARERVQGVGTELDDKRALLEDLQRQAKEQEEAASDLEEQKSEFNAAAKEAERVKDACRGVSISEIAALKGKIHEPPRPSHAILTP